jgi:hypothetical protein
MRHPMCCICHGLRERLDAMLRARVALKWRRPVSTSCRPGPSSILRLGGRGYFRAFIEHDPEKA